MKTKKKYNKKNKNKTIKNKILTEVFFNKKPELVNVNGIYLLLLQNNSNKSTKIQCSMFGGNYLENEKNCGIAHLLEHLLMSASKHCGKELCETYLKKYGIKSNASTHDMYTNYWVFGLKEYTQKMLDFITSIILDPKITKKILEREKNAVKHELESLLNDPDTKFYNEIYKNFYKPKPYKNSVDYKKQIKLLKNIDMNMINSYLNKTRLKNCFMFTISGNFNKKVIVDYFNKLKISHSDNICKLDKIKNISECYTLNKKTLYVRDEKATSTKIVISYPIDIKIGNKYGLYLPFLNNLLTGGLNSILLKRLRLELNLVYGIRSTHETNLCGTVVNIETSTDNNNVKKVIKEIFRLINYYIKEVIPKRSIEEQKINYRLNLTKMCKNNPSTLSVFYKHQYFWQLHKKNRKIYTFSEVENNILALNSQKLKKLMKMIFDPSKCLVAYMGKKKFSNI